MNKAFAPSPGTLVLLGMVLAASQAGCIASPAEGTVVGSTSSSLTFSGYHIYASTPLRVKAYNFSTRRYDTIATAVSSSRRFSPRYWDDPLYSWSAPRQVLPTSYWSEGRCAGSRAVIKGETVVSGRTYGMYSWDAAKNAEGCLADNRNNSDWVANCSANQSNIKTSNYSDAPRALNLNMSGPFADSTCAGLEFRYSHTIGSWSDVRANLRIGGTNYGLSCAPTSSSSSRTFGVCRINRGSISGVRSVIERLRFDDAVISYSAVDLQCRDRLRSTGTFTARASTYDYNWTRWSASRSQCIAPPPPPPVTTPRTYDIRCGCVNENGVVANREILGCINSSASVPTAGASLMCGWLALDRERRGESNTTCWFVSMGSPQSSCPVLGVWDYAP